jgi:protocatechuate 3,4-dioxygenase alpha subunit
MSKITTSQTIGPFSHEAWRWATDLSTQATLADRITISGIIYDGDGTPLNDAQIESWQPAAADEEAAMAIPGFRRAPSDEDGRYTLHLSACARQPGQPFAYITVFARGLVKHQFSAVFLADDTTLAQSAILEQVPAARRHTLLAEQGSDGSYGWDIHLQGVQETAFFDYV